MKCIPSLDAADVASACVCPRWATTDDEKNKREVGASVTKITVRWRGNGLERFFFGAFRVLRVWFGGILLCIRALQSCRGLVIGFAFINVSGSLG